MKKFTLAAAFAAMTLSVNAQGVVTEQSTALTTIQEAEDVVIVGVSESVAQYFKENNKIKADYSINDETRHLYIWTAGDTYAQGTISGMNSVGTAEDYFCLVVVGGKITWSGMGISYDSEDVSFINDDYYLHLAMKSNDNATHALWVGEAKMAIGDAAFESTPVLDNFPRDGKWYNLDIPVKVIKNFVDGGVIFKGDDLTKWSGNIISFLSGGVSGTELNFDQVFFYKKGNVDPSGISSVKAENANATMYNLAGQKVDANYRGIVVKNGKKFMNK